MTDEGLIIDLFAGGGGASAGIEAALGRPIDIALNHNPTAMAVHEANHPHTRHLTENVWKASPREVTQGRPVALLWASPDCTFFSRSKGGKPRNQKIRVLACAVTRWLHDVAPATVMVENVPEFENWGPLGPDLRPDKSKMGKSFRCWISKFRKYGYSVDWRVLDASLYGAPTRRKRLFVIARRDGLPVVWPKPTHGPGLAPRRQAAECIDWSIPCTSIFDRIDAYTGKRLPPLAEKTMWRIAQGLRRFVFENSDPFILKVNHGGLEDRSEDIHQPLTTVTAQRRGHGLVVPVLQHSGNGERKGQRARAMQLDLPLTTIMATGEKHALVMAFLAKHFGDPLRQDGKGGVVVGSDLRDPMHTVTGRDHHSLAAVTLAHFRGTDDSHPGSADVREPMPTLSAQGTHVAEVRAFLSVYYGSDGTGGQLLTSPMRTLTGKHRMGLVTVHGVDYQVVDIGFRMLQPHELLRAQFGRFAAAYDLSRARTKKAKVFLIGNSVCPEMAEALVRSNVQQPRAREAA